MYLDNILVFSKTVEKHKHRLRHVLVILGQQLLVVREGKYFFSNILRFLGHIIISEERNYSIREGTLAIDHVWRNGAIAFSTNDSYSSRIASHLRNCAINDTQKDAEYEFASVGRIWI